MSLEDLGSADVTAVVVGLCVAESCSIVGVRSRDLVTGGDCGRTADIADGGGGGGGEISGRVGLVRS